MRTKSSRICGEDNKTLTYTKHPPLLSNGFQAPLKSSTNKYGMLPHRIERGLAIQMLQHREAVESVQTVLGLAVLRPWIVYKKEEELKH